MPGAVPVTATRALGNATLPYVLRIADEGLDAALAPTPGWKRGSTSGTARSSTRPSRRRWRLTVGEPASGASLW